MKNKKTNYKRIKVENLIDTVRELLANMADADQLNDTETGEIHADIKEVMVALKEIEQ